MAGTQIQGLDALMGQQIQLRMNEGQGNKNAGPGSEFEDLMAQAAGVLEAARMANGQEQTDRQAPGASADTDITQLGAAKSSVKPAETADKPKASHGPLIIQHILKVIPTAATRSQMFRKECSIK